MDIGEKQGMDVLHGGIWILHNWCVCHLYVQEKASCHRSMPSLSATARPIRNARRHHHRDCMSALCARRYFAMHAW